MSGPIFGSFARIQKRKVSVDDMLEAGDSNANEKDFSSSGYNSRGRFSSNNQQFSSNEIEPRNTMIKPSRSFYSKENTSSSHSGQNSGDKKVSSQNERSGGSTLGGIAKSSIIFHDFKRNDNLEQSKVVSQPPIEKSHNNESLNHIELPVDSDPTVFLPDIKVPLGQRLKMELPMAEYNYGSVQVTLEFDSLSDKMETIENTTTSTQDEINELRSRMEEIMIKSEILNQTATVVSQKLVSLNEFAEFLDNSQENTFIYSFGWVIWFLTLVNNILTYVWGGIKKQHNRSLKKSKQPTNTNSKSNFLD